MRIKTKTQLEISSQLPSFLLKKSHSSPFDPKSQPEKENEQISMCKNLSKYEIGILSIYLLHVYLHPGYRNQAFAAWVFPFSNARGASETLLFRA